MEMDMRFGLALASIAVALVSALPASAQAPRELIFGLPSKSIVASAPRIADEMGLFTKHGLKPKFTYIDTTAGTAAALISKSVEVAITGTTEVIAAAARGQALQIVATHYKGLAGSLILSKATVDRLGISPDAPLAERLKALNNVLLASTSKVSSLTISIKTAANSQGAEPRFSYMAIGAMGAALESGVVEGAIITAPGWAIPVLKGAAILWISAPKGDLLPEWMPASASVTAVAKDFAAANPDVAAKVAAVFADLVDAFANRPTDTKAAIAKLYPQMEAKTLDLVFSLESKAFITKPLTPADIAHEIKYMKASGADLGPIEKVEPAATLWKR
jgi:ABC-type nitrate/sulfonate/bicarbonate transport system substrate-binding protein